MMKISIKPIYRFIILSFVKANKYINQIEYFHKNRKLLLNIKNIKYKLVLSICLFIFIEFLLNLEKKLIFKEPKNITTDKITLVTAFYKMNSKHSFNEYLEWINNILKINSSIVFYTEYSMFKLIKNMRPKEFENKTIWIEYNMKNFYTYKHYLKDFNETYNKDIEKKIHSVPLYLIWAEKCKFLENAIIRNYFNSKCFYWVDAGYFRNSTKISSYINDWPSSKNCFEDPRVIFNVIRASSKKEIEELKRFNINTHLKFQKKANVGGGMFGGHYKYVKRFVILYYKTIELFIKKKIFIGKDQNIFAYISYLYPDIIKLVFSGKWFYLQDYLS